MLYLKRDQEEYALRRMSRAKKILLVFFALVFFASFGLLVFLDSYYAATGIAAPQPELGRIYDLKAYGIGRFLTREEKLQVEALVWIWSGSIIAIVLLVVVGFKPRRR